MTRHPDAELSAYAAGSLSGDERARVERHLEQCAPCRDAVADFRALLDRLAATAPSPPPVAWPRYRAELRARRDGRRRRWTWRRAALGSRDIRGRSMRWLRPAPLGAMAAAVAAGAIVVYVAVGARPPADLAAMEADGLAARMELIDHYAVVEQLDLLEDLDVIRNLDRLAPTRDG